MRLKELEALRVVNKTPISGKDKQRFQIEDVIFFQKQGMNMMLDKVIELFKKGKDV